MFDIETSNCRFAVSKSIAKRTDEMDYQRACQAYIWGLPIVGIAEWQKTHDNIFKVRNGQWVSMLSFDEKLGIMTPNFDTHRISSGSPIWRRTARWSSSSPRGSWPEC